MNSYGEIGHERAPRFRPTLAGCVGKDLQLCSALVGGYERTLGTYECFLEEYFLRLGGEECAVRIFRELLHECEDALLSLGELIVALGARALPMPRRCRREKGEDARCRAFLSQRRVMIDFYEGLMCRTGDRVVRSVISRLISCERRMASLLCELEGQKI